MDLDHGDEFSGVDFNKFLEESSFQGVHDVSTHRPRDDPNQLDLVPSCIESLPYGHNPALGLYQEGGQLSSDFPGSDLFDARLWSSHDDSPSKVQHDLGSLAHSVNLDHVTVYKKAFGSVIVSSNEMTFEQFAPPTLPQSSMNVGFEGESLSDLDVQI